MGIKTALLCLIFLSLVVESTLFPFPFVLLFSLLYIIFFQEVWALVIIFFVSVLLDALTLQHIGITAIFVTGSAVTLGLFEKTFSLQGMLPAAIVIFASILFYTFFMHYPFFWVLIIILGIALAALVVFERKRYKKGGALA